MPGKIITPCGELDLLPTLNIPFPPKIPDLSAILALLGLPTFAVPLPTCDVVTNAIGAAKEPDGDSQP